MPPLFCPPSAADAPAIGGYASTDTALRFYVGSEATRWEPGQLANWLTGIKPAPFDEDEAMRRNESRQSSQSNDAQRIRESVNTDAAASGVPQWVADGTTVRRLREAGLGRCVTEAERLAAGKIDEIDQTNRRPTKTPCSLRA